MPRPSPKRRGEARASETPILQRGAKPRDLRSQERARAVNSSRMGEIQRAEGEKRRKSGVGEVRRYERRAQILEEGAINRVAHRMRYGKKTST